MGAKVFDLSSYLEEKKATIKLGDLEVEINDGFNDLLKIDALTNRKDELEMTEFVKEFLRIALGVDVADKLIAKNYRTHVYVKIMDCIQEVYAGSNEQEGASSEKPELV